MLKVRMEGLELRRINTAVLSGRNHGEVSVGAVRNSIEYRWWTEATRQMSMHTEALSWGMRRHKRSQAAVDSHAASWLNGALLLTACLLRSTADAVKLSRKLLNRGVEGG